MLLIYITIVIWVFLIAFSRKNTVLNNKYTNNTVLIVLFAAVTISIYNIKIHSIPDLHNYAYWFSTFHNVSLKMSGIQFSEDPLFFFLQWCIAQFTDSISIFLIIIWGIIYFNIVSSLRKLFDSSDVLFVFFSYATFFIFFSYVLNTMRQGLAISFLIVALSAMIYKKKNWTFILSIIIAPIIHITALPISLCLLLLRWFKIKLLPVFLLWVASILLFISGYNSALFKGVQSKLINTYTSDYALGRYSGLTNRVDFLLFSVFIALIAFVIWRYILKKDTEYEKLLIYYLLANSYFLCLGFIAFSDRIAAYSWFIIPILIWKAIPKTKNSRYKVVFVLASFLLTGILSGGFNVILKASIY